jgi:hypothetical protein
MIDPKQIPKAVIDAAYHAYWHEKPNSGFAEAIAAALNAWPGVEVRFAPEAVSHRAIILPLPKEGE